MQPLAYPQVNARILRSQPVSRPLNGHGVFVLALFISFPVIGLDQFLRTPFAQFSAQPTATVAHWIEDSLMAVPLFAIAILAGDWIAGRAGLCTSRRSDAVKRAALITALSALVLAPAWFQVDRTDDPVTAQPLVFPHASDSGDVYWVSSAVIVALACISLLPLAAWAGRALTRGQWPRPPRTPAAAARTTAALLLVAAVPVTAWLLHQAAVQAYASRVYDTSAQPLARPRPHQVQSSPSAAPASPSVSAVPGAFAYQAAHALQDGLVGQALGFPVTVVALIWGTRTLLGRDEKSRPARRAGTLTPNDDNPGK
jgi:hypothetical protein